MAEEEHPADILALIPPDSPLYAPPDEISADEATLFNRSGTRERHPKETKGHDYNATTEAAQCRTGGDGSSCC